METETKATPKSFYHAVLLSPEGKYLTVSAARKIQLRRSVAESHSDCEVIGLFRGKKLEHQVQKQIQF